MACFISIPMAAMDDISFDMNFDSETATRIREIAAAKERAVQAEDYDTAKRLKVRKDLLT
jgi:hypothetical protein